MIFEKLVTHRFICIYVIQGNTIYFLYNRGSPRKFYGGDGFSKYILKKNWLFEIWICSTEDEQAPFDNDDNDDNDGESRIDVRSWTWRNCFLWEYP